MKAIIIILSYNRPKMLRQAIMSVMQQTHRDWECWVVDDGSDTFSAKELLDEFDDCRITLAQAPELTAAERLNAYHFSENINWVIDQLEGETMITYLCDDDILHPYWLERVNIAMESYEHLHVFLGKVYHFYDDGSLEVNNYTDLNKLFHLGKLGYPIGNEMTEKMQWWNLGGVVNRLSCYKTEELRWGNGTRGAAHSWDIEFFQKMREDHLNYLVIDVPSVYIRVHNNSISYKIGRMEEGTFIHRGGELLPEHITGLME